MTDRKPPFASVEEALEEIRAGRMIVLVDDEDRENEGDLTIAAEKITPEAINFMAKFGRGLICLAMTEQRCDALGLAPITPRNTSMFGTPFCEPIDARRGTTTGTSAGDRATLFWRPPIPTRVRKIWRAPATSIPYVRAMAACWSAPGRPKLRAIWRASRAWTIRA